MQREAKKAEPNLTITRIFRETLSPGTSRKPALERLEPPLQLDSGSESDYDTEVTKARKTSSRSKPPVTEGEREANRSKSDDDEIMVLDPWDVAPAGRSPSSTPESSSSSDTEEDELAIQALVEKVAAKVRAEFLKGKEKKKKKKMLEKEMKKKRN